MKIKLLTFAFAAASLLAGCEEYDDSGVRSDIKDLQGRVAVLEQWCETAKGQIGSLQGLVTALESKNFITGVTPVMEGTEEVGYTITFQTGNPITIRHGADGGDGDPGATPRIGAARDPENPSDETYYWTVKAGDGEPDFILDEQDNKIPVTGEKGEPGTPGATGRTPVLSVEEDDGVLYWQVDGRWLYNGADRVPATGEQGDAIFQKGGCLLDDPTCVTFVLADGTELTLPRHELSIGFDSYEVFTVTPASNVIGIVLPETLKEEDYNALVAEIKTENDGSATDIATRAVTSVDVEIVEPTFSGGEYEGGAAVKVAWTSEKSGTLAVLKVTLIDSNGQKFSASRILEYASGTVEIHNAEELFAALENQSDNQKWIIHAGEYDVTKAHDRPVGDHSTKSSRFVITANGITVQGIGNPVIEASADGGMQGGDPARWEYNQGSTVLVYGKDVTLDGLTVRAIDCSEYYGEPAGNKAVTVSGADNFTLKNCLILPAENKMGGSVIFDGGWSGKKATVEDTRIEGALITKWMGPAENQFEERAITVKDVVIDPVENGLSSAEAQNYYGPFSSSLNAKDAIRVEGRLELHIHPYMTQFPDFTLQQIFDGFPVGSTVVLHGDVQGPVVEGDPYYTNTLRIGSKMTVTCAEGAVLSGIIVLDAPGIVLDAVNYHYKGNNTLYGNVIVNASDVTVRNSELFAEYDLNHCVNPAQDRDRSSEFGFICLSPGEAVQLLDNSIQTNAMGVFGGSGMSKAVIRGNTVRNLDGYSAEERNVWLNSANMNGVRIEGNTVYNRHMVLGGDAVITGNRFLNLGENGSGGHAFYFFSEFTGTISGNDYSGRVDPDAPLAKGSEGVPIPSID